MSGRLVAPDARVFVDTNVFVYARDASEPDKSERAGMWLEHLWNHRRGRVSMQVLQEYYVTVTRKLSHPMPTEDAQNDVRTLFAWHPQETNRFVLEGAFSLQKRFQLSWWDALIVSQAQCQSVHVILSEDLQHGQDLGGVRVVNPFLEAPDS